MSARLRGLIVSHLTDPLGKEDAPNKFSMTANFMKFVLIYFVSRSQCLHPYKAPIVHWLTTACPPVG